MNEMILVSTLFFSMTVSASDFCGKISKGSEHAQLIPVKGKVLTELQENEALPCGSMVITRGEAVWVEMQDLTVFKIAPNSFFEFAKKGSTKQQLLRGEAMVSAPPSIREFELTTPNSVSTFHGGVMIVSYSPKDKETTLASFNRKMTFQNKFHAEAVQTVNAGEMSRLWIGEANLSPSQPEVMNPNAVKAAIRRFSLASEEENELIAVVKRTLESRDKSMVADLESWEDIEREQAPAHDRTLASVTEKKSPSSIDRKEAEIGLELMKKRLYGDESDQKMFEESRDPASVRPVEKLNDPEYRRKKAAEKTEVKRVTNSIRK